MNLPSAGEIEICASLPDSEHTPPSPLSVPCSFVLLIRNTSLLPLE